MGTLTESIEAIFGRRRASDHANIAGLQRILPIA
jgi:hypothetical protein